MGKTFKKREKDRFARKKKIFENKKKNPQQDFNDEEYKKQNRGSKKDKYF